MANNHTTESAPNDFSDIDWGSYSIPDGDQEAEGLVSPTPKPDPEYHITATSVGNGTCTVSTASEIAGNTVAIHVQPNEGFELYKLNVTTASGTVQLGKDCSFVMPNADVKVVATFVKTDYSGRNWKIAVGVISWITAIVLLITMLR